MAQVTIQELREHSDEVLDRVAGGEPITITRAGKPVAELRPVKAPKARDEHWLDRWHKLEPVDPIQFRKDIDSLIDPSL